ncbi:MAG: TFIIB-type zinc finger domain-containing protein [Bacilli bacterium]|nr:TFIIB-type zinc finger domain-containing protein [Bacilli bacterium]
MKQLTCEMCGSNDLIKQDGVFVCQSCGCKYSVEEAKKMMVEVSGSVSIETPVEVKGIAQIETMLENATNTYNQGNYVEAYRLFSEVLNLDPRHPKAILYRGLSAGYQSTVAVPKYEETSNAAVLATENAINIYDDKELELFATDLLEKFAILTYAISGLYDGYITNMDSAVKVYGITGAIVKANTMNDVTRQANTSKIFQYINYLAVKNKAVNPILDKLSAYSDSFCSSLVKFLDAGYTIGGTYTNNLAEHVPVLVEDLEELKRIGITENKSKAFENEKQMITKLLSMPYFGKEEDWNKVQFWAEKYNLTKPEYKIPDNKQSSDGCYVATCVYGSYDCPQVWTLRRFRDNTLAETMLGRAFIRTYYAISPTLVKWVGDTSWFKKMWKGTLDRMVSKLQSNGVEDTPYQDRNW